MPERTSYEPGTPSWVDLATTDPEAAKGFYAQLFGWDFEHRPTDMGPDYILARRGDKVVGGMMIQPPDMAAAGAPPCWNSYVDVTDADATMAKVASAGGSVVMPTMDVMDQGRMAVFADPTGAVIGIWQKGSHFGAELVNEHGALCWNEAMCPDVDAAAAFYGAVFGWTTEQMDMGELGVYTIYILNGEGIAGAMAPPMEGIPPHWGTIFAVDDVDAAVATVNAQGGTVMQEPLEVPEIGRVAAVADPQGAALQIMQMANPGT